MGRGLTFEPFSLLMEKTPLTSSTSMASFYHPNLFFPSSNISPSPRPLLKKLIIGIIYGACSKSLSVLTRAPSVCLIENCRQFYQNYPNIVFSSYCIEVIGESRQLSCLKEIVGNNKIWIVSRKRVPEVGCCNDFCQTLSLTEQKWSSQNHLEIIKSVLVLRLTKLFWREASPRKSCFLKPYTWPLFRFRGLSWLIFKQVLYTFMYRYLCRSFVGLSWLICVVKKSFYIPRTHQALWPQGARE